MIFFLRTLKTFSGRLGCCFFWGLWRCFRRTWIMIFFWGLFFYFFGRLRRWSFLGDFEDVCGNRRTSCHHPASLPRLHWLGSIETRLPFSFIPCSRYSTCLYMYMYILTLYIYILANVDQITVLLHYRFTKTNNGNKQKNGLPINLRYIGSVKTCTGIKHSCGVMRYKIVLQSNSA